MGIFPRRYLQCLQHTEAPTIFWLVHHWGVCRLPSPFPFDLLEHRAARTNQGLLGRVYFIAEGSAGQGSFLIILILFLCTFLGGFVLPPRFLLLFKVSLLYNIILTTDFFHQINLKISSSTMGTSFSNVEGMYYLFFSTFFLFAKTLSLICRCVSRSLFLSFQYSCPWSDSSSCFRSTSRHISNQGRQFLGFFVHLVATPISSSTSTARPVAKSCSADSPPPSR